MEFVWSKRFEINWPQTYRGSCYHVGWMRGILVCHHILSLPLPTPNTFFIGGLSHQSSTCKSHQSLSLLLETMLRCKTYKMSSEYSLYLWVITYTLLIMFIVTPRTIIKNCAHTIEVPYFIFASARMWFPCGKQVGRDEWEHDMWQFLKVFFVFVFCFWSE